MSNQQLADEIRKALDAKYWTLEQANQVPTWLRSLIEENETLREEIKRAKWEDEQFTWLQDQVKICAEENAQLRSELAAKDKALKDISIMRGQNT